MSVLCSEPCLVLLIYSQAEWLWRCQQEHGKFRWSCGHVQQCCQSSHCLSAFGSSHHEFCNRLTGVVSWCQLDELPM
jgi:hypothetical protein